MILRACAVAVLCLVSASRSDPPACEELIRPSDRLVLGDLEGTWALVAGSLSHPPFLERFKQRDSASVRFAASAAGASAVSYTRSISREGECMNSSYTINLQGSSFTYEGADNTNLTSKFVHTGCEDCLLMHMNVESGKRHHFYLFSRRRRLEPKEMEEFNAQVACMNLPPAVVMDPTKDLCPDEAAGDPAPPTEQAAAAAEQ